MIPPPPSYFAICFSLSLYTFFTILLILIWSFLPPLQFTRLALPSLPFLPAPFSPASLHHLLPPPSSLPLLLTAATLHHSRPFATPTRPAWRHAANTWANSNIYPFCYFWSLQSSQQGGMESIDGRNLILPFPLRVERHSLSSIFVPFRRGGGKIFFLHISPRCNAPRPLARRAHSLTLLASTRSSTVASHGVYTLLLAPLLRESIFHLGMENLSGSGFQRRIWDRDFLDRNVGSVNFVLSFF